MAGWPLCVFSGCLANECPMMPPLFLLLFSAVSPVSGPMVQEGVTTAPIVQEAARESARAELAKGRSWRATSLLKAAYPQGPGSDQELVLLFARAEAGWKNWGGVLGILEGSSILEEGTTLGDGSVAEAWFLYGRALEGSGRLEESQEAYGKTLDSSGDLGEDVSWLARARSARIYGREGRFTQAADVLEGFGLEKEALAGWLALEIAGLAAEEGSMEETRVALSLIHSREVRSLGWDLPPKAILANGDSLGAEAAFWSALPSLDSSVDQAEAWDRVGTLRLARGDSLGARGAFHQVLSKGTTGPVSVRVSATLLELGFDSVDVALIGAQRLASAGRHERALLAFGVYEELLGESPPPTVLLEKARSHLSLGQGRAALELVTALGKLEAPQIGGPALAIKIQALRQLGRGGEVRGVQDDLVARFPTRAEAVEVLFLRADALQDRGDREGAIQGYRETVALSPSQNLAGQSRMRMGQLFLAMDREEEALDVFLAYLDEFPDGRRWDEAAFWAGRTLSSLGREGEAREVFNRLRNGEPLSYYAIRAGEALEEPYDPPFAHAPDSLPLPDVLRQGLDRFDDLLAVELEGGASWEADALADLFRQDPEEGRRHDVLLRLAHELNDRGFTREGINLGWEVQGEGRPMDRHLLAAIYPFPYQIIVEAEAAERDADPYLLAGLIRQESAFWLRALSRADARGLMQVLPSTGRELARRSGPQGFRADDHLYEAEINIHLGTAFFADMRRRFGDDLPIILSAYNAGPTRANRWKNFPEAADMVRFVERIPFTETRGYVKNVLRNRAVYTWLYGPAAEDPEAGSEYRQRIP